MDDTTFDDFARRAVAARDRRASLKALGAAGAAVLGVAGLADGASARKRRKRRCSCPNSLATRLVVSSNSADLATAAGSQVSANADCGGVGKVVSCGYQTGGSAAQFVNAVVNGVGATSDRSECVALLLRTAESGATAGAHIQATAVCLT